MKSVSLSSPGQKARLDVMVDRGPPHLRPLYGAVREFGIGILMVSQTRDPFRVPAERPTAVIIGDDLDKALGPGAFHRASLKRMIHGSSGGVIVASAPPVEAYALLAATTLAAPILRTSNQPPTFGHAFLIETLPEQERAWTDLIHEVRPGVTVPTWTVRPEERGRPGPKVDYDRYRHIFDGVPD